MFEDVALQPNHHVPLGSHLGHGRKPMKAHHPPREFRQMKHPQSVTPPPKKKDSPVFNKP